MERTRPKNAYENWLLVAENIEAHPINYHQSVYAASRKEGEHYSRSIDALIKREDNICGTAFCRAGWAVVQVLGEEDERGFLTITNNEITDMGGWDFVNRVLSQIPVYSQMDHEMNILTAAHAFYADEGPGSPEYAKMGADGVRQFAEKWREHLEAVEYTYPIDFKAMADRLRKIDDEAEEIDAEGSVIGDEERGDDQ